MVTIKLGLIADVQYCDCDDGWNFLKTKERYYRNSLNHLDNAMTYFLSNNCKNVLQLGDLIDGKCHHLNITEEALQLVGKRFENNELETFHVVGNHELYNLSREEYYNSFMGKSCRKYQDLDTDLNFYKVDLSSKVRLIVLDTYDLSVLNRRQEQKENTSYKIAEEILKKNNKNANWNNSIGLKYARFVSYNGGIDKIQLSWLKDQLVECTLEDKIVIVAGHVPILGEDCVWNYEEILQLFEEFDCVKAYIAGHLHNGGIVETNSFIHITIPGIIECLSHNTSFGVLRISESEINLSSMTGYWGEVQYKWN